MSANETRHSGLAASYDKAVDVLYIIVDGPHDVEGEGLLNGLELDYSVEDGQPCGATVIGYWRNGWQEQKHKLAELIGHHVSVDPEQVMSVIRNVIGS